MLPTHRAPIHPGEMLLEEFLKPAGMTRREAAARMKMSVKRLREVIRGKRGVTADTAVRLAAALGTSERFWLGLQADYDLEEAHRPLGKIVDRIQRIAA